MWVPVRVPVFPRARTRSPSCSRSPQVGDQCAIDLEQAAMEAKLNDKTEEAFVEARAVYNDGADGDGGRTL